MSLLKELKRRNVFKVGIGYVIMAWLVLQVADVILNNVEAPQWVFHVILLLLGIGLLFVIFFAWVYELTPQGIKKERDVNRTESVTHVTGRKLDYFIIAVMAVALGYFAVDKFMLQPPLDTEPVKPPTEVKREQVANKEGTVTQPENSIAVLPFINMSDDPGNEFFSDGISEELLNLLAKIPELHVAARTSSFSFKGQMLEIPEIAERLNVAHVLEGSVRKAGNRVRITAQLTKANDGYHLWSETYDRTLEDVFAIQDEIAAAVVDALKVTLLGKAPTVKQLDPDAYALYLQAQYLHARGTDESVRQSTAMLKQALALAPDYAKAWRALSRNYGQQVRRQLMPREEGLALSHKAINQALAIDPLYAEAHATLGYQTLVSGDLKMAAHHFTRAISLEPTNEIVLNNANGLIYTLGRLDQGHLLDKYLAAKDPLSPIDQSNLAQSYLWLGKPDDVIATVETLLLLSPGRPFSHLLLARALLLKGENEAAFRVIQEETGEDHRLEGLVMVHHALSQKTESDAALTELIGKYGNNRPYHIAGLLAYRDEADHAFEWLEKAAALDPSEGLWNLYDEVFINIHNDPRWLPFLESIGMSPAQLATIEFKVMLPE